MKRRFYILENKEKVPLEKLKRNNKEKRKKRVSIRLKWMFLISIIVLLVLMASVTSVYIKVSSIFESDNITANRSYAKSATSQINIDLKNYENSLELAAQMVTSETDSTSKERLTDILESVQKNNKNIISAYYMDGRDGSLMSYPKLNFNKDARETLTYKTLTEKPETKWMDVYKDELSQQIMTAVVTPVLIDGKMVGALGYDVDLSAIGKTRKDIEDHSNSQLIILDSQGFIVSSFMEGMDGKNINPKNSGTVEGVEDLLTDSKQFSSQFDWVTKMYEGKSITSQPLKWAGKEYTGQVNSVPELNWKVLSFTSDEIAASKLNEISRAAILSEVFGLLFGVLCALFLANVLRKIIANLEGVIGKTASGDLVTEYHYQANDEFGDLSVSYNAMLSRLRGLIEKVNDNTQSVTNATSGLSVIAAESSTAISEVSRSIEEIAIGAANQSEHVEQGASAIRELSNEMDELREQSNQTQSVLHSASRKLETGKEQVDRLETSYQKLEAAFKSVTHMSTSLVEKSKTISNVTHAISQIAEQTNLLSLNASIEAARAGEHGKGFAVVANEVRTLADDSKKATIDIQNTINSILSDTENLLKTTNETNQISLDQKSAVLTVRDSMIELETSVIQISHSINKETKTIGMLNEQKKTVIAMIEEITAVSQQTTAASEEIASSMEEQAASSNELAQYTQNVNELINELEITLREFIIK